MTSFTAIAKASGALRLGGGQGGGGSGAPAPHFDSILRAAPAYDDDDDGEGENEQVEEEEEDVNLPPATNILTAIRPHLQHHSSLHAYLDANMLLEEMILGTQERIYEDSGRLKSQKAELKRANEELKLLQSAKGKGAGSAFWMPKKKKAYKMKMEESQNNLDKVQDQVNMLDRDWREQTEHIASLKAELTQFKRVEARLDALDNQVFSGHTPAHPDEDELEQKYHILWQTSRRLQSYVQLEKRAQQHLTKAHTLCQTMVNELLKGLNIGIETGVANNTKHKTQLWKGTDSKYTARHSRGVILRAKTLCGDLHTHYISARAIQRRITQLPKVEVIELTRLPDQWNSKTVNEKGLHRSLESSYAQSKIVKSHIEKEREKSVKRQKKIKEQIYALQGQARSVWLELRQMRRNIIEVIRQNEDEPLSSIDTVPRAVDLLGRSEGAANERPFNPSIPPSAEASARPSMSGSFFPPPYRRELASQSSLGIQFPPLTTTDSGTLADLASSNDWEAREQHRLISLPRAFRRVIDRESIKKSKEIVTRIAVEVGGLAEDDDITALGHIETPFEEDIPGFHLAFN